MINIDLSNEIKTLWKWISDDGSESIYRLSNLDNDLLFYYFNDDPDWERNKVLKKEEIKNTNFHKQSKFDDWNSIPDNFCCHYFNEEYFFKIKEN